MNFSKINLRGSTRPRWELVPWEGVVCVSLIYLGAICWLHIKPGVKYFPQGKLMSAALPKLYEDKTYWLKVITIFEALFIYKYWRLSHNAHKATPFPTFFVYIVYVYKSIFSVKVNICMTNLYIYFVFVLYLNIICLKMSFTYVLFQISEYSALIEGWKRKRSKCFFTYINLDLFRSHHLICKQRGHFEGWERKRSKCI